MNELINALPDLKKNGTSVNIKRVIEDGDYVAIHSDLKFFGDKVAFTVFGFENGKICNEIRDSDHGYNDDPDIELID